MGFRFGWAASGTNWHLGLGYEYRIGFSSPCNASGIDDNVAFVVMGILPHTGEFEIQY
jgi:hypothetical protein